MPQLSVIVPVYNSAKTLESCLCSIRDSLNVDYELIVVDDASRDESARIAEPFADQLIRLPGHQGRSAARNTGIRRARGEILVNVDSDVLIPSDTLLKINNFFAERAEVEAVSGILSLENPVPGFFSQYKNAYMRFVFRQLPDEITFIYGSICAWRAKAGVYFNEKFPHGSDTEFGRQIRARGGKIIFMRELEVVHLKSYNFLSFIINDFKVPYWWAVLFQRDRAQREILGGQRRFAHASFRQVCGILSAPLVILGAAGGMEWWWAPVLIWAGLHAAFFAFLTRAKGFQFGLIAVPVTFLDNFIMLAGMICGFIAQQLRIHKL